MKSSVCAKGRGRNSNIELLRVTAMSLIILHHMMVHGLNPGVHSILYANLSSTIYPVLEIGVNLFFMISGYFGVKLSLQSILKLAFIIFLFTIVNYLICLPFNIYPTLEDIFLNVLFPISKANYWFISVYLGIIMVSPLINMGLNGLDRNKLRSFIVVFTFFTVYSCGFAHNTSNPSGYTFLQGLYLYCLAHFFYCEQRALRALNIKKCFMLFVILVIVSGLGEAYTPLGPCLFDNYNGLFIIGLSALLFIVFTKIEIQNKLVNYIASCALGCYLLQDGFFGTNLLYPFLNKLGMSENTIIEKSLIFISIFLFTWIASLIISPFINHIATSLSKHISTKIPQKVNDIFNNGCVIKNQIR